MCCYMHVQQVTLIAYLVSVRLLPCYLQPYNSHDHLLSDKTIPYIPNTIILVGSFGMSRQKQPPSS